MNSEIFPYLISTIPTAGPEDTVGFVMDQLRTETYTDSAQVLILETNKKVYGHLLTAELFKHGLNEKLKNLVQPCAKVHLTEGLKSATRLSLHSKSTFLTVVDEGDCFLGLIPSSALMEILRKEHIDDMHKMAGIKKERSGANKAMTESPVQSVMHRLPWLMAGLVGSFFATFLMSRYEETLNNNISLAFFIPGIVYLADAIGTQTETMVIRGLSMSWTNFLKILKREFLTGWLIGFILGLLCVPVAIFGGYDVRISLVVGLSVMVAGMLATTIGLLLPWVISKLGKDPAFGSGPLATIIQDILSIFVFLLIAKAVLPGL